MSIAEKNELVAIFMGMGKGHPDKNETRWKNDFFEVLTVEGNVFESGRRHTHLAFDRSWDWFMPFYSKLIKACGEAEMSIYEDMEAEVHSIEDAFGADDIATAFGNTIDILEAYNKILNT